MKKLTYKQAGVDIGKGEKASRRAREIARQTFRREVEEVRGIPAFSARFASYQRPLLLGATDGVGTKLKIAFATGKHDTVGIDLVAMCVNDLVRRGAEPIIFLPYVATSKVVPEIAAQIAKGVAKGCKEAGCSVLGGETAELPDFYKRGEYDLAGFALGVVEKDKLITGEKIKNGDVLIGLPSSGLHSNGFSLVRKVLPPSEELLTPTRIYVKPILRLLAAGIEVHGIAHITGGGIPGKLGKIIPKGLTAQVNKRAWTPQPIFSLIQKAGNIDEEEMLRTFNMGIGMILVVPQDSVKKVRQTLTEAIVIGEAKEGKIPIKLL